MTLPERLSLIRSPRSWDLRAVADVSQFGFVTYLTASLPDRVYVGLDHAERPASILYDEAAVDVEHLATPLEVLLRPPSEFAWPTESRRTLQRLESLWLLCEDVYRLLDAERIDTLAHQASLVEHIASSPDLLRVLIADEVGLGKTVEAGLLIRRLSEASGQPLRTLYLTEARLVRNVVEEFEKLGLRPREWSTAREEARLTPSSSDPLVVASMHRAVVNRELVAASGPWDVLFVDEAHHLTDWSPDGSDPQQRMRLCRDLIRHRLAPGGRVYLLTGTPHQGSEERFDNLLRLLSTTADREMARGKVIYRIKDDIVGWDGRPLFPRRRVNPPIEIDGGPLYGEWLARVHALLSPSAGHRAGGWRRAQALQWCASSPQAGLAYLARLAIRSGFNAHSLRILRDALLALRPYRGGPQDETADSLEARLLRGRVPLEEEPEDVIDTSELPDVLRMGIELIRGGAFNRRIEVLIGRLRELGQEKLVVFAQPIETVYSIKQLLQREFGDEVASFVIGDQDAADREREIAAFRERPERRVLISSRAGGEGINLQVARHLVHFDVPWNPMEMEQRVGRVHRYGSVETVIVDTLVLRDSREQRVLDRSRARLGRIVRDLDSERFELLFSRTMALIPLEELAALMAGENFGPLSRDEEERIDRLVTAGYLAWRARDAVFRQRSEQLRAVQRGPVTEDDFLQFLLGAGGAKHQSGWAREHLEEDPETGLTRMVSSDAQVLLLGDGSLCHLGAGGIRFSGPAGAQRPRRIGLNDQYVAEAMRAVVGGAMRDGKPPRQLVSGAGAFLVDGDVWTRWLSDQGLGEAFESGALVSWYVIRTLAADSQIREVGARIVAYAEAADGGHETELEDAGRAALIRMLRAPRPKRSRPASLSAEVLLAKENRRLQCLRQRQHHEPIRAVFPIAALWVEPTSSAVSGIS